jgi:hypothetical protein
MLMMMNVMKKLQKKKKNSKINIEQVGERVGQ